MNENMWGIFLSFKSNALFNLAAFEDLTETNVKVCKIDKFAHMMKNIAYYSAKN